MSFALTKGIDDEDATEFVYVACAYACVASENQALRPIYTTEKLHMSPLVKYVPHIFEHVNNVYCV